MNRTQLLARLNRAWAEFQSSYADLSAAGMSVPGVTGGWSVKDIVAHVAAWEQEALTHLPTILAGGRPPRYSAAYGGIDAFNARTAALARDASPAEILRRSAETHRRLIEYVSRAPEDQIAGETRFRRRLRLDTYGHYPEHTRAILRWRARSRRKG